jgi:hypothetical protein
VGPRAIEKPAADWNRVPPTDIAVDCHVHLFPERLFEAIRRWFAQAGWAIPYPHRTGEVLDLLRAFGVRECWALPYAHKPGVAAELNAWMADVQREHAMVRGFFAVHPDDDVADLARRAVDDHGLCGMKIHCEVQQVAISDPRLDPAFDLLERRGLPCVLHSGDAPYPYTRPHLDVSRVAERLRRNPALHAVIAHLGAMQTAEYLKLMDQYPGLHLEISFTKAPGVAELDKFDWNGLARYAERILFGSDFPNLTFIYAEQVENWLALDWVRQNHDAFFGGNAHRLLSRKGDMRLGA